MKWINVCGALLTTLSIATVANAGLFGMKDQCGAAKGSCCAPTYEPEVCKPVITKPCCPNVYTYQRKCSDIKPPCCDVCAPQAGCGPAACAPSGCAPKAGAPQACAPKACAPQACAPKACAPQACAPQCAAPQACAPTTCAPVCRPAKKSSFLDRLFGGKSRKSDCCAPAPTSCAAPVETRCCDADPCEIAMLIYESQTACYAKDRRKAIHKLGDRYDCVCNPEIMCAFVYALNDADEDVRKKAADEIGDQIRKNGCCCCTPEVVSALTCALGDCDKGVVRQATEALEACGYEVVEGCCDVCAAGDACGNGCAPAAPAPAPSNGEAAPAPAPAPPADTNAYRAPRRSQLSQLLGLLD